MKLHAIAAALLLCAFLLLLPRQDAFAEDPHFQDALQNGVQAREALREADHFLLAWTARKDEKTALFSSSGGRWTVRETATRIYPQMALTAFFTNPPLLSGLLRETLQDEARLTSRLGPLPDDFDLDTDRFVQATPDTQQIRVDAARYACRGLAPIADLVGPEEWEGRIRSIVDELVAGDSLGVSPGAGRVPSGNAELDGYLLCLLPRLAAWTGQKTYLDLARRIEDVYCDDILPNNGGLPAGQWDIRAGRAHTAGLSLDGDGVSIVEGLAFFYAVEADRGSHRAAVYRPVLNRMFDVLLEYARTPEGFFYARIEPDGRGGYTVDRKSRPATWSRLLDACLLFGQATRNAAYIDPVRHVLETFPASDGGLEIDRPETAALALPGMFDLLTYTPDLPFSAPAHAWADAQMRNLLNTPEPTTHLRTDAEQAAVTHAALSSAWFGSAGVRVAPWRDDLVCGATTAGDTLYIALRADQAWDGRFTFDRPRHRTFDRLQNPVPDGEGFPERYAIDPDAQYTIQISGAGAIATWAGSLLQNGLKRALRPGEPCFIRIWKARSLAPETPRPAGPDTVRSGPPVAPK